MGLNSTGAPRTLSEALRALPRADLVGLLQARPDLAYPLPRDLSELAAQSATGPSIRRAVDRLTAWQREVLEALAAGEDPVASEQIVELTGHPAAVATALNDLRALALTWGSDDSLRLVRGVRDHLGPYPGGLAPPSSRPLGTEEIEQAMAACGPEVEPVLRRLVWGPPTGAVRQADRTIRPEQAQTPVERLLAHRLLRPQGPDTVILPREVAWWLRARSGGARLSEEPVGPQPPELSVRTRDPSLIDRAATGAALTVLHDADLAVQTIAETSVQLLRDGRLSARDFAMISRRLSTDTDYATFVVELAAAAGLVDGRPGLRLLPTLGYDRWVGEPAPERWRRLADAWRTSARYFLAATSEGGHPLGPEAASSRAAETRDLILRCGSSVPPGALLDLAELGDLVRWRRPALGRPRRLLDQVLDWTWREAAWLGLSALGATSTYWTVVAAQEALPDRLVEAFPAPIEQVIIQSDLTAVAPGPLRHEVGADLRLMADEESRGGGSVYRFAAGSLRRAFDAGWVAQDLHDWLARHSSTPVPQPLSYLIDDVSRQHGTIRVGPAEAVLRVEDPAQQVALLGHPEASGLRLRALGPGVLAASATPEDVVEVLHRIGLTPVAEDDNGRVLSPRPPERAPNRRTEPVPSLDPEAAADAILAADRRRPRQADQGSASSSDTVEVLAEAERRRRRVQLGFVTTDGSHTERLVHDVRMLPGLVRAVDARTSERLTIPIGRISAARPAD